MSTPPDQFSSIPPERAVHTPSTDDKNLAMLTHLSGLVLNIIVPLVVWLMHKDRYEKSYLIRESKEALNFQITVLIGYLICWILFIIAIGHFLIWVLMLLNLVFCIVAAIKVSATGSYRYPFALRLVS